MAYEGKLIIDADTHVYESADLLLKYIDAPFRDVVKSPDTAAVLNRQRAFEGNVETFMPGQRSWKRALGVGIATNDARKSATGGVTPIAEACWEQMPAADCNVNATARLLDMDKEGVDVGVIFPTSITGAACLSSDLEQALYRSYHRWLQDFCSNDARRLKGVMVGCLRDVNGTVAEMKRVAGEKWCVGVLLGATPDEVLLDDPRFHPVWAAAQEADFALLQHCFTPRPPFFPGINDMGDNSFVAGTCSMPFAAMRNTAALIGGGVFDEYRDLRYGIIEAGSGWFPYFMDRIEHTAKARAMSVPLLKSRPSDFLRGPRFFLGFGFEEDGETFSYVSRAIGDGHLMYGSDYCHPECHFPRSVQNFTSSLEGVSELAIRNVLGETARRLYARI